MLEEENEQLKRENEKLKAEAEEGKDKLIYLKKKIKKLIYHFDRAAWIVRWVENRWPRDHGRC